MKAKTLALTAIICGASILGLNLTPVYAATVESVPKIEEQSQSVRDRNRVIGAVLGVAAVAAVASKNKHDSRRDNYRQPQRHTPPPPPQYRR